MGREKSTLTHAQLVERAVSWLRHRYRCGIVLSEQYGETGEVPDALGWKGNCRSVLVECKISRTDFLADSGKQFRQKPEEGIGCERFYLAPAGLISRDELPPHWGLLEYAGGEVRIAVKPSRRDQRSITGMQKEMHLLLASLRRVEVRIEPQTLTEFLKWKQRLMEYNGGTMPRWRTPALPS